jgi:hypothetical protein
VQTSACHGCQNVSRDMMHVDYSAGAVILLQK